MGEAYRTWIILPYQSTVCVLGTLHVFSSIKMLKRQQATLGEFGFTKRVCHRGAVLFLLFIIYSILFYFFIFL